MRSTPAACAAALALALSIPAPAATAGVAPPADLFAAAAVDAGRASPTAWTLPATATSAAVSFELRPMPLTGPSARLFVGDAPRPMPELRFLAGEAPGRPGAFVVLAVRPDGRAVGHASLPGRPPLVVRRAAATPGAAGAAPIWTAAPAPGRDPESAPPCGVTGADVAAAPRSDAGDGAGAPDLAGAGPAIHPRLVRVAVEADEAFVNLFDGDVDEAAAYAVTLVGGVSAIYRRDLGLTLRLDFLRLWPDGDMPFSASSLGGFREWWQENQNFEAYELVHLFSGRRDLGYGGVAFLQDACTHDAYGISGFLNGFSPESPPAPGLDTWDLVVVAHEMGHNLGSPHTWNYEPAIDGCFFGTDERGTVMSYCHTRMGGLLNLDVRMHAAVQDQLLALNPVAEFCLPYDCNQNLVPDDVELAAGVATDVNRDGIIDDCQDCNANGVPDPVEIAAGELPDLDGNGRPDACDPDCDGDGVPDAAAIASGAAVDADGDRIPDACEADCDGNGVADHVDIDLGTHVDLDRDGVPDVCVDCNGNGLPDWLDAGRSRFVHVADPAFGVRAYHGDSGVRVETTADPESLVTGVVVGGMTFLPGGALVAAVPETGRLVILDDGDAAWRTLADTGTAVRDVVTAADGTVLAAIGGGGGVTRFDPATGAALGDLVAPGVDRPDLRALDLDPAGRLLVVDAVSGAWILDAGTGAVTGGPLALPRDLEPRGVAGLVDGDVLVSGTFGESFGADVWRLPADGSAPVAWGGGYSMVESWDLTRGPSGDTLHVPTQRGSGWRMVEMRASDALYLRAFVRGDDDMTRPTAIAFRPAGAGDVDGDLVPDACDCPGDLDRDGSVTFLDLLGVLSAWGEPVEPGGPGDLDGDADVDFEDLLLLLAAWGPC